jgi:hypothetical protein
MGSGFSDHYVVGRGVGFCGDSGHGGVDSEDIVSDLPSIVCPIFDF